MAIPANLWQRSSKLNIFPGASDRDIFKMFLPLPLLLSIPTCVWAQTQYTSTATSAVAKAAATALTLSPTSNVAGLGFDRFVQIWLENTDYKLAVGDSEWSHPML